MCPASSLELPNIRDHAREVLLVAVPVLKSLGVIFAEARRA
jgi:hypothetical protein